MARGHGDVPGKVGGVLKVLITGPGTFVTEGTEEPMVGTRYELEDITEGTSAQNRLFHPLAMEFWQSGMHSSRGSIPLETEATTRFLLRAYRGAVLA